MVKPILVAVVAIALSAYASECFAMATPQQAMQCCKSRHCASHGHHGQDCCKTMPTVRVSFGQPSSSMHRASPTPVVLALVAAHGDSRGLSPAVLSIAAHCHAPPILYVSAPVPIRI